MDRKKQNNGAAIVTIAAGFIIIAGIIIGSMVYDGSRPKYFNNIKKPIAEKLYSMIINRDYDNDYPQTPEEVMVINNNIFRLVYGDMLLSAELLESVLTAQRRLYTDALLNQNTFDAQLDMLIETFEQFRSSGSFCVQVKMEPPVASSGDPNLVSIKITQLTNNLGDFHWLYYLERESETAPYKISGWTRVEAP